MFRLTYRELKLRSYSNVFYAAKWPGTAIYFATQIAACSDISPLHKLIESNLFTIDLVNRDFNALVLNYSYTRLAPINPNPQISASIS